MSDPDLYSARNYTQEEIDLLREHDENETLHAFEPTLHPAGAEWACTHCGDTEEGLMHNNTWRNVEPLLEV